MTQPLPLSVQLYSLREAAAQDFIGVLKAVAAIGYPAVEFAGLHGRSAREIKRVIDDLGLKVSSAHVPLFDSSKHAQIEEDAAALGVKHLVGGFGAKDFESPEAIRAAADKTNATIAHFAPKGYKVHLHNHEWEFNGPNKGDLLLELAPQACAQLDVYWIKVAGANPAEVIQRYRKRVHLIHIKDGPADPKDRTLPMTAVGQGTVNIPDVVRAAEYAEVEYLIVELDRCATDMLQAVRESYEYMTRRSLARGNR
ncbi:MAG TPA: sugar phosphate isomerase/epimerase [Planctomycetota bacterium]|nr:sugar phosphate isomerase/epimerase [Planctomycetota bacterium]